MELLNEERQSKPYFGFSKLKVGYYECVAFRIVNNKQYKPDAENPGLKQTLLVELKDQVLFMPKHISAKFIDNQQNFEALTSSTEKIFLFFGGSNPDR